MRNSGEWTDWVRVGLITTSIAASWELSAVGRDQPDDRACNVMAIDHEFCPDLSRCQSYFRTPGAYSVETGVNFHSIFNSVAR